MAKSRRRSPVSGRAMTRCVEKTTSSVQIVLSGDAEILNKTGHDEVAHEEVNERLRIM